jgi:hypothetical protein
VASIPSTTRLNAVTIKGNTWLSSSPESRKPATTVVGVSEKVSELTRQYYHNFNGIIGIPYEKGKYFLQVKVWTTKKGGYNHPSFMRKLMLEILTKLSELLGLCRNIPVLEAGRSGPYRGTPRLHK